MKQNPERLQDPERAASFRTEFDELLEGRITDKKFKDFYAHAHEEADEVVLAASVFEVVREEIDESHYEVPKWRRRILRHAGQVATQVEKLDDFLRDNENADDIVLFTYEKIRKPLLGSSMTGFILGVVADSHIEHYGFAGTDSEPKSFIVEPHVAYGCQSTTIMDGRAEDWIQGSKHYFEVKDEIDYRGKLGQGFYYRYRDLAHANLWGGDMAVPSITTGREDVLDLFQQWLDEDSTKAYTENRRRRPSYTLYRQANYMDDPAVGTMAELAEDKGILHVWQDQMADEEAIRVVAKIRDLRAGGKPVVAEAFKKMFSLNHPFEDMEWMGVTRDQIVAKALMHAKRLGVQTTQSELEMGLEETLQMEVGRKWQQLNEKRLASKNAPAPEI